MTSTKAELVRVAMEKAGQLATGQNPAADEAQSVSETIDRVLSSLALLRVVYVADPDEIEDGFMEDLGIIVSEAIIKTRDSDDAAIERSQNRLRKMQAPMPARRTLQVDPVLSHTGRRRY